MEGIPASYLGRIVSKDNFRVYIYSSSGQSKLVNSWDEYECHMESGLWFAVMPELNENDNDSHTVLQDVKPKRRK